MDKHIVALIHSVRFDNHARVSFLQCYIYTILKRYRQSQDGVGSIFIIVGDVTKHSSHAYLSGLYSPTVTYPKFYKMLLFYIRLWSFNCSNDLKLSPTLKQTLENRFCWSCGATEFAATGTHIMAMLHSNGCSVFCDPTHLYLRNLVLYRAAALAFNAHVIITCSLPAIIGSS